MRKAPVFLLGLIILLVLVASALSIGAVRGYRDEKAQVESALTSLDKVFGSRVETGNNLLTVARRHLSGEDPMLLAVERDVKALSEKALWPKKMEANLQLEKDAGALLKALEARPSVREDSRDLGYVTGLLPQALDQSAQWADAGRYNEMSAAYNERLRGSFSGWLARFFGVGEAELFKP